MYIYKLYKLRMKWKLDDQARVARVHINKPYDRLKGDDLENVKLLVEHFTELQYHVIVED